MTRDGTIAQIMGWPVAALVRSKAGLVCASWFPIDGRQAVLYSGDNRAVLLHLPMSKALEEEYRAKGLPK